MLQKTLRWFICDKHGRAVIWQKPNLPIIGWFAFMVVSHLLGPGALRSGLELLSAAFLFTWAYLEITQGASPFRRVLGAVVFVIVIIGFFCQ
ncbi:MAG TPA: hypothetical protein VGE13_00495 [Candidatus Saccharimonadales bacterium]